MSWDGTPRRLLNSCFCRAVKEQLSTSRFEISVTFILPHMKCGDLEFSIQFYFADAVVEGTMGGGHYCINGRAALS